MKKFFTVIAIVFTSIFTASADEFHSILPLGERIAVIFDESEDTAFIYDENAEVALAGKTVDMLEFFERTLESFYYWRMFAYKHDIENFDSDLGVDAEGMVFAYASTTGEMEVEYAYAGEGEIVTWFYGNQDVEDAEVAIWTGESNSLWLKRREIINIISDLKAELERFQMEI